MNVQISIVNKKAPIYNASTFLTLNLKSQFIFTGQLNLPNKVLC